MIQDAGYNVACDYVQVDESTLPVIDNEKHRAVKGYVWSVVNVMTGDRFFFYEHGSRSTRVAIGLLKDFAGSRNTNRQGKTTQTFFPQTGAPCPQSNSSQYHTPIKRLQPASH